MEGPRRRLLGAEREAPRCRTLGRGASPNVHGQIGRKPCRRRQRVVSWMESVLVAVGSQGVQGKALGRSAHGPHHRTFYICWVAVVLLVPEGVSPGRGLVACCAPQSVLGCVVAGGKRHRLRPAQQPLPALLFALFCGLLGCVALPWGASCGFSSRPGASIALCPSTKLGLHLHTPSWCRSCAFLQTGRRPGTAPAPQPTCHDCGPHRPAASRAVASSGVVPEQQQGG